MVSKNVGELDRIVTLVNDSMDAMMYRDTDGAFHARVCMCCDRIVMNKSDATMMKKSTLQDLWRLFEAPDNLPSELIDDYTYSGEGQHDNMNKMMLSRYTCYNEKSESFLLCKCCQNTLKNKSYPLLGIKNGNFSGYAPVELEDLTEVELAFISPVRVHGHLFTYFGGERGIKGWQSLLKCDMKGIVRSLHGMERLSLPNRIAVVLTGPMSKRQKEQILKKSMIRRDICWRAIQKLLVINETYREEFKDFDMDNIQDPILIDRSVDTEKHIENNIEITEEFTVVFPDATLNETYGGFDTVQDFKKVLEEVNKTSKSNMYLYSKGEQYVAEHSDNNFVKIFLKQFPYGRGGPSEIRKNSRGESTFLALDKFIAHVNDLADPNFHDQLFTLVSYNILQRQKMLNRACWRLKTSESLQEKIANVTDQEIRQHISSKKEGIMSGTLGAMKFTELVDTS